jgi:protein-serine/threonine kinase
MRDSKSVDFDRASPSTEDIIHATAGSPSALTGTATPGILTPRELTSATTPGTGLGGDGNGPGGYEAEVNPFGEFSSVTRDIGDW